MALDPVPFVVGGGAVHGPEVFREAIYAAVEGSQGVVGVSDMRVTALATPGGKVRVATGGCIMTNVYSGGSEQSYVVRAPTETLVDIDPTDGTGGRTDYLIVRVDDPQYGGSAPEDVAAGPYDRFEVLKNQASGRDRIEDFGLGYPACLLAQITIPASTAAITGSMITDRRTTARPRTRRYLIADAMNADPAGGKLTATSTTNPSGEWWPNAFMPSVFVPLWATRCRVTCTWAGIAVIGGGVVVFNTWVQLGGDGMTFQSTQRTASNPSYDSPNAVQRYTAICADDIKVPVGLRGQTVPVGPKGLYTNLQANPGVSVDGSSSMILDIEFYESARDVGTV